MPRAMVYFRERVDKDLVKKINLYMVKKFAENNQEEESEKKKRIRSTRRNKK